jgi:hypothetical protein
MSHNQSFIKILTTGRPYWDRAEIRPVARKEFDKVLKCRTSALGAAVFESDTETKLVFGTCKSRVCPSCGQRATLQWHREQWAALPDIPYKGIVFTMPNTLWPVFRQNRHLLRDLPTIGAAVIQQWAKDQYGVRVIIVVVLHTFGRRMNFNCHLHILVSAGGLQEPKARWIPSLYHHRDTLMRKWRDTVVSYLSKALDAGVLKSELGAENLHAVIKTQGERWWNIRVQGSQTKEHFLRYACRYVRHPPIAEHRITQVTDQQVEFWRKDTRLKRRVKARHSIEEFVVALAEHIPDFYGHAIRYYGLWAPSSKGRISAALFAILKQQQRHRPRRLSWRESLRKYFGTDPLLDSKGQPMHWVGRMRPCVQPLGP